MKVVHCPCGTTLEGQDDDEIVGKVQAHVASDHPEIEGGYDRAQILELAHEH